MKINEVFYSLQGEGLLSGLPTIFIRTAGCNLRCSWCDTRYAARGRERSVEQVLGCLAAYPCRRVCVTGGEPLRQRSTLALLRALRQQRYSVSLETNGSYDIAPFLELARLSVDVKCPSSGMTARMRWGNLARVRRRDQVKFVIADRADYDFARSVVARERLTARTSVIFQPVGGRGGRRLAAWLLRDGLNVRLGLQLHKILWGCRRGR